MKVLLTLLLCAGAASATIDTGQCTVTAGQPTCPPELKLPPAKPTPKKSPPIRTSRSTASEAQKRKRAVRTNE